MNYLSYNNHLSSSLSANFIQSGKWQVRVLLMSFEIENADKPKKRKLWVKNINGKKVIGIIFVRKRLL
ncbi:unnamed protein product [Blepharisma stoltei]|uniref:Uncharacterized protein n=1 Tax=Blepharisma stoltei TaxID=1481888 RepID=A0AAU9I632_9CILI|nr:unnamed protein product [Blepharisma stoltei]